mgnify:CR=1 FL=1
MLFIKCVQGTTLKFLAENLKEFVQDCNLIFSKEGIILFDIDHSRIALSHCFLHAERFEEYTITKRHVCGIYMNNLYNVLKNVIPSDIVKIKINDDEPFKMYIIVENVHDLIRSTYEINLMNIEEDDFSFPTEEFSSITYLPSVRLQRIFRELASVSETVCIRSQEDRLQFICNSEFGKVEKTFFKDDKATTDSPIEFKKSSNELQEGHFLTRYLKLFTKAKSVSDWVELYLQKDFPLILKYKVSSLGELIFVLSPTTDKKVDNHIQENTQSQPSISQSSETIPIAEPSQIKKEETSKKRKRAKKTKKENPFHKLGKN